MLKSALLVVALLLAPTAGVQASEPTMSITAKNWAFAPSTITLHRNQKVKLVFTGSEGLHGITIPDLGIDEVVNIGSSPSDVEVTPKKLGAFTAHCAVFCGAGHADMVLTIKVIP